MRNLMVLWIMAGAVCLSSAVWAGETTGETTSGETAGETTSGETSGERIAVEQTIRKVFQNAAGQPLPGTLVAYDAKTLWVTDRAGAEHALLWAEQVPSVVYDVHVKFIDQKAAEQWMTLGRLLASLDGGDKLANRAFGKARHLDPDIDQKMTPPPAGDGPGGEAPGKDGEASEEAHGKAVGAVEEKYWGKLTAEQSAASIEELKQFAKDTETKMEIPLKFAETDYFLFYTDLPRDEGRKWAKLLDKMYNRLCDIFDIPRGTNVWRGKALIFVFSNPEDYHRFQATMHGTNSSGSAGMCHNFGNGMVHIAFYRQANLMDFAHILVHESVHGFLHRYRKPLHVPSWANEGLAEVIGQELVPESRQVEYKERQARTLLEQGRTVGANFFVPQQIEGWQYGVASMFTRYMIRENKKGYVKLINAIKDGVELDEAFEEHYGAPRGKVVDYFGRSMNINGLK